MAGLVRKSLDSPEETRPFEDGTGKLEVVNLEGGAVGRATFQPGWQWSKHVKPIAKTDSCQAAHMGYFISGRMKVVMDDGEEMEYGPGDFAVMAPGHDAWIIGNEPCVVIDWQGFRGLRQGLGALAPEYNHDGRHLLVAPLPWYANADRFGADVGGQERKMTIDMHQEANKAATRAKQELIQCRSGEPKGDTHGLHPDHRVPDLQTGRDASRRRRVGASHRGQA